MDWFEQITGFPEASYAETQSRLSVIDGALVSLHSPRRPKVGQLETPSLAELRARVAALPSPLPKGGPTVSWLQADARQLGGWRGRWRWGWGGWRGWGWRWWLWGG